MDSASHFERWYEGHYGVTEMTQLYVRMVSGKPTHVGNLEAMQRLPYKGWGVNPWYYDRRKDEYYSDTYPELTIMEVKPR